MRRLLILFTALVLFACKDEISNENVVTLKGKLNYDSVEKVLIQGKGFEREIAVDSKGYFSDTLNVTTGIHAISYGNDRLTMFLKNGYDLELKFKGARIEEGAIFSGEGAETNNFIESKRLFYMSSLANPKTYFSLQEEAFKLKLDEAMSHLQELRTKAPDLDSLVIEMDNRNDERFFKYIESNYEVMSADYARLGKGKVSPSFVDYENHAGGTTSLADLKGKYVYIDVWATWCAPCKVEIPHLKSLEKEYESQNIAFVSISVDVEEAHKTWKEMVQTEELTGIQLYADNNFKSDFIVQYGINAIPRFILIDPQGNIVDSNAPRPSNPELKTLLNENLGI